MVYVWQWMIQIKQLTGAAEIPGEEGVQRRAIIHIHLAAQLVPQYLPAVRSPEAIGSADPGMRVGRQA
jgi:hypothetical protein